MPIAVPPPTRYVDASYFQSVIDVNAYKAAGFTRIAHRATYRDTGTDSSFVGRWPTFTGLTRQAYHFAYEGDIPDKATAHFLDVVASAGGFNAGDEAMLDCEWFQAGDGSWIGLDPAHGKEYAAIWNAAVATQAPDVRRFFYGNAWWFQAAGITAADFPNVGMITASYGASYAVPAGWPHSCIWQYTDRATVPGFPGELVDFNEITCPSSLDHLTIGDDEMQPADWDKLTEIVNTAVSNGVKAELTYLMGQRQQPHGIDPKTQTTLASLADAAYVAYHGIQSDATHPGFVDAYAVASAVNERVANLSTGGGTVDPNVVALTDAVNALNNRLATISWTLKASP